MKRIVIASLFLIVLLTGCRSINTVDEDTYMVLKSYQEKIGGKCAKYMKYDVTLSSRDRNTLQTQQKIMTQTLNKLTIEK